MIEDNYAKAYREVIEILKYIPEESVNKIPKEIRKIFEEKQSKSYNFQIDIEKPFEEQKLLTETRAILANLYRDYLATPSQKEKIIAKEKIEKEKEDDEKRKKYNIDNLFKNK